jgi:hypothetical protein
MFEVQVTRRSFVRAAGIGMALRAVGPIRFAAGQTTRPGETPLFRFVQWNDVHIDETQPPAYELANAKMRYLVDWINDAERRPRPDFVIGIGDMIHGGSLESLAPDTRLQKELLGDLKIPFYPVVGNHENVQQEGDPKHEAAFREAFGDDRTNYTLKHKGILFVMLNNSGAPRSNSDAVGRRRNEWFRSILDTSADLPRIVCCHIPLVPLRDEPVLAKSFGFSSYTAKDERLLSLVDEHARSILAVLSGHLHLTGVVTRNGVHHVSISGTASYPCDFASYDVFPGRIQLRVHSLPENLLTPRTNIHGRPRHEVDYTDSRHPTPESYVKGNPVERTLDIER